MAPYYGDPMAQCMNEWFIDGSSNIYNGDCWRQHHQYMPFQSMGGIFGVYGYDPRMGSEYPLASYGMGGGYLSNDDWYARRPSAATDRNWT